MARSPSRGRRDASTKTENDSWRDGERDRDRERRPPRNDGPAPPSLDIGELEKRSDEQLIELAVEHGIENPHSYTKQDLLYRINTVEIRLPPLRDRREDLPLLIGNFLDRYCRKYKKPRIGVHPRTLEKLKAYSWPGNVRELQHAIERAVIMNENGTLQPSDFPLTTSEPTTGDHIHCEDFNLDRIEKTAIRKAIEKHQGNISHTARELGITRSSLYRRLEKYGL